MDWSAIAVLASITIAAFGGLGALVLWLHALQSDSANQRFDRVDTRLDKIDTQIDELKDDKVDVTEMRRELTAVRTMDSSDHAKVMAAVNRLSHQVAVLTATHNLHVRHEAENEAENEARQEARRNG